MKQPDNSDTISTSTGAVAMVDAFAMSGDYDSFYQRKRKMIRWLRVRDYLGGSLLLGLCAAVIYIGLRSGIWK